VAAHATEGDGRRRSASGSSRRVGPSPDAVYIYVVASSYIPRELSLCESKWGGGMVCSSLFRLHLFSKTIVSDCNNTYIRAIGWKGDERRKIARLRRHNSTQWERKRKRKLHHRVCSPLCAFETGCKQCGMYRVAGCPPPSRMYGTKLDNPRFCEGPPARPGLLGPYQLPVAPRKDEGEAAPKQSEALWRPVPGRATQAPAERKAGTHVTSHRTAGDFISVLVGISVRYAASRLRLLSCEAVSECIPGWCGCSEACFGRSWRLSVQAGDGC